MKILLITVCVLAVVMLLIALSSKGSGEKRASSVIKGRAVLTANEQPMYFRLAEALPEHIVLAQVAFSALLTTKLTATRNKFDRKVADFVICKRSFEIVAIIELDDSSHKGREAQDTARQKLITGAGYKMLRYSKIPNIEKIQADIKSMAEPLGT